MAEYNTQERQKFTAIITIAVDNDLSDSVDLKRFTLGSFRLPAGMDSVSVTFQASDDDITFDQVRDASGSAIIITIDATAATYTVNPQDFASLRYLKIATSTGESSNRTITFRGIRAMR